MIRFGREICGDLPQAERREWWLTNGLGGYAAGTIAGSLTRRYHGLLITPVEGALDRHLLFAKAETILEIDGQLYPLSCNHWQSSAIAPQGNVYLESFRLDGQLPVWIYAVDGVRLEQRIFMPQGETTVWLAFRLLDSKTLPDKAKVILHLRLLINQRDHHGPMPAFGFDPEVEITDTQSLCVNFTDSNKLHLQLSSGELHGEKQWLKDFLLPIEQQRGLADWDNHLAIANARIKLNTTDSQGEWHGLRAGIEAEKSINPLAALQREQNRGEQNAADNTSVATQTTHNAATPDWIAYLKTTAKTFLFRRPLKEGGLGESVIAGYPWFADWGRDTMIALPGLTLATRELSVAQQILLTWADYVNQGMIPNRFPESVASAPPPEYNSVDASLWYILACHAYSEAGGDASVLHKLLPVLEQIISAYRYGTRYQIHMDESSGLLHVGEPGSQLTWMDARVDGIAATPRIGKPVEINALWYNALHAMQYLSERLGLNTHDYSQLAENCRLAFKRYQRPEGGLYDVLDTPEGNDASIRPNQIFALSLPWPLLDKNAAQSVFKEVHQHLYTSYGLRSLRPDDPAYQGIYKGSVRQRDSAYHNGPVWGWLLGHHVMAHFRLYHDTKSALALLTPMRDHLFDAGLGSISEIFDGDPPHTPRGAPSQAWSVATILQAWQLIHEETETL